MGEFLKFRKLLMERSVESDEWGGGKYNIDVVVRDEGKRYQSLDGITYEIADDEEIETLYVAEVEHTEGNQFYEDQVDAYVNYLENDDDPIIQTFPVQKYEDTKTVPEYLEDWDNAEDYVWDWNGHSHAETILKHFEKLEEIEDELSGIGYEDTEDFPSLEIIISGYHYDFDIKELLNYDEYEDTTKRALKEIGYDEKTFDDIINTIQNAYKDLQEIVNENGEVEHTLEDMNHRFKAVKRMGVKRVLADVS